MAATLVRINGVLVDPATITPEQAQARYNELVRQADEELAYLTRRNRSINYHPNTLDSRAQQRRLDNAAATRFEEMQALAPYLPVYECEMCGDPGCDFTPEECASR